MSSSVIPKLNSSHIEHPEFDDLPVELRKKIWRMTWEPRIIQHKESNVRAMASARNLMKPPVTLAVNRESRAETLQHYDSVYFEFLSDKLPPMPVFFNYNLDTVHIKWPLILNEPWDPILGYVDVTKITRLSGWMYWETLRMIHPFCGRPRGWIAKDLFQVLPNLKAVQFKLGVNQLKGDLQIGTVTTNHPAFADFFDDFPSRVEFTYNKANDYLSWRSVDHVPAHYFATEPKFDGPLFPNPCEPSGTTFPLTIDFIIKDDPSRMIRAGSRGVENVLGREFFKSFLNLDARHVVRMTRHSRALLLCHRMMAWLGKLDFSRHFIEPNEEPEKR